MGHMIRSGSQWEGFTKSTENEMTLRVILEIVPFGCEEQARRIQTLHISNTGIIEDLNFGNQTCSYEYSVSDIDVFDEHEVVYEGVIDRHNRRDGALSLVKKVVDNYEQRHLGN